MLLANCRAADARYQTYLKCFDQSQFDMNCESFLLRCAVYQSSATVEDPAADSAAFSQLVLLGATAGGGAAEVSNRYETLLLTDRLADRHVTISGSPAE
jgi:hypothetical protein